MNYREINGNLYRADTSVIPTGGIMGIELDPHSKTNNFSEFEEEVLHEIHTRNFAGVLVDNHGKSQFLPCLASLCRNNQKNIYLSENDASIYAESTVLVETAVFSGTLRRKIEKSAERFGAHRLLADIERIRIDYTLPAQTGEKKNLSEPELHALIEKSGAKPFFSNELCAWYFNYRSNGKTHFVLFDDAVSIKKKLALLSALGVRQAMFYYPEISDIAHTLLQQNTDQ